MARKKRVRPKKYRLPIPYFDPATMIWVNTKEGGYPRRKRGTVKPAVLNASLQRHAEATALTNIAALRIVQRLTPFLRRMDTGRLTARIAGKLKKAYVAHQCLDYSFFTDFDIQPFEPLKDLLPKMYTIAYRKKDKILQIAIHKRTIQLLRRGATHYQFELIWLWGDPGKERTLRIDAIASDHYPLQNKQESVCELVMPAPAKKPYVVFLKVSCLAGGGPVFESSSHGMQVIETG